MPTYLTGIWGQLYKWQGDQLSWPCLNTYHAFLFSSLSMAVMVNQQHLEVRDPRFLDVVWVYIWNNHQYMAGESPGFHIRSRCANEMIFHRREEWCFIYIQTGSGTYWFFFFFLYLYSHVVQPLQSLLILVQVVSLVVVPYLTFVIMK